MDRIFVWNVDDRSDHIHGVPGDVQRDRKISEGRGGGHIMSNKEFPRWKAILTYGLKQSEPERQYACLAGHLRGLAQSGHAYTSAQMLEVLELVENTKER